MISMLSRKDAKLVRLNTDGTVDIQMRMDKQSPIFGFTVYPGLCNARGLRHALRMYKREGIELIPFEANK